MDSLHNPITRLNAILHRRTMMHFDREFRPYGLSFTHVRVLMFLARHDGARQEDIRSFIDADKGGVAHAVKRLVDLGLVARSGHPDDGRAYVIGLTESGREMLTVVSETMRAWNERIIVGFSADELAQAEALLSRMVENACVASGEECEGGHR